MFRFSLSSLVVGFTVASIVVWLNWRESTAVSHPYYAPLLGAAWHAPPYELKEMAVDFHRDRGWPVWHTRHTQSFAAHQLPRDIAGDQPPIEDAGRTRPSTAFQIKFDDAVQSSLDHPSVSLTGVVIDTLVGIAIVAGCVSAAEIANRGGTKPVPG